MWIQKLIHQCNNGYIKFISLIKSPIRWINLPKLNSILTEGWIRFSVYINKYSTYQLGSD